MGAKRSFLALTRPWGSAVAEVGYAILLAWPRIQPDVCQAQVERALEGSVSDERERLIPQGRGDRTCLFRFTKQSYDVLHG